MGEWDEEIRHYLGPESALRRITPKIKVEHPIYEVPVLQDHLSCQLDLHNMTDLKPPTMERMRRFVFSIRRNADNLKQLIRFTEVNGVGDVVYSISEDALTCGFSPRDTKALADMIANAMRAEFNREAIDGRR